VVVPTVEGSRPILIELQALVADSSYSSPVRRALGIDPNRLALLNAVLEKRVGMQVAHLDIFVSVVGGLKISEPAVDLGAILAIASSLKRALELA
jgi:Predicted ATP-dependent serine protease